MEDKKLQKDPMLIGRRIEIGKRIREIRQKRGYSQEQLADLMGIQRSTVSKIENGSFSVSIDYLFRFSVHLNFEIQIIENEPVIITNQ